MPVMRGRFNFSRNEDMAGMEDLQVYLPAPRVLFRELKSEKGDQSDEQLERQNELRALGHDYGVWRDVDDIFSDLERNGLAVEGLARIIRPALITKK